MLNILSKYEKNYFYDPHKNLFIYFIYHDSAPSYTIH